MRRTILAAGFGLLLIPQMVGAANLGNLVSDDIVNDYDSWTKNDIQHFFDLQGGYVADLRTEDVNGRRKSAAEIIYDASQRYLLNPKFLITHLQKESSLLTITDPSKTRVDFAMGYGVCNSCSVNDPAVRNKAGFGKQVDFAAWQFRRYWDYPSNYHFKKNGTYTVNGKRFTIQNKATALNWNYTLSVHGQELYVDIWNRWFARLLLSGTLAEDESGKFYLIRGNEKRLIANETVLNLNFDTRRKIRVSSTELATYRTGKKITLPTNFFFRAPWGTVYFIDKDEDGETIRRGVKSQNVLHDLGVSPELIFPASSSDLMAIPEDDPLTTRDYENRDRLLRSEKNGGIIYQSRDGRGHTIYGRAVLESNFPGWKPEVVKQSTIDRLRRGDPVRFREGDLVTDKDHEGSVYVISENEETGELERRAFANSTVFEDMGYSWDNILHVTKKELDLHPKGKLLRSATQQ